MVWIDPALCTVGQFCEWKGWRNDNLANGPVDPQAGGRDIGLRRRRNDSSRLVTRQATFGDYVFRTKSNCSRLFV